MKPGFFAGFAAVFDGVKLLWARPRLRIFALVPAIAAVFIFFGAVSGAVGIASSINSWWLGSGILTGAWASVTSLLVWLTALPVAFFVCLILGYALTKILLSPLYALLAERALNELGVLQETPFSLGPWLMHSLRMFRISLLRALFFSIVGVLLFVCSFIPLVNLMVSWLAATLIAMDCVDYSHEAVGMGFRQRLFYVRSHLPFYLGFGLAIAFILFLPGLNFVLFPSAVAGGACMMRTSQISR